MTVTVSVSTGVVPPLWNKVKMMLPAGLKPPANVAASVRIGGAVKPSVTVVGLGAVASVGLAALTATARPRRVAEWRSC